MKHTNDCEAALAQTDITPAFPVELIGCMRDNTVANGILYPLLTQVLLFRQNGNCFCLVAIDSLGLTEALSKALRERVASTLGTPTVNVMLNFSHTHSAPAPKSPLNGARYFSLLCNRVAACARRAQHALAPCLMAWGTTTAYIGENRREGCHITDSRLGALQVVHANTGAPIALLLRVCAHANVLMEASRLLSSDYFGPARQKIAAWHGAPVMFLQGAAGNIKPAGVHKIHGGTAADVLRIAARLAQSACKLRFAPQPVKRLQMCQGAITLYSDVPSEETALKIAQKSGMDATAWLQECQRLRKAGITRQATPGHIHFLFLNEGCLCGVPDEIFCELALEASNRAQAPLLFFNGYTNGCTGYLPHREEWEKGGYETLYSYVGYYRYHGHVLPFRPETAERLVSAVVKQWQEAAQNYSN